MKRIGKYHTESNQESYEVPVLIVGIRRAFENILNKNTADLNLNRAETLKRENIKSLVQKNLRNCGHGDLGAKNFIKDYIKDILEKSIGINGDTINLTLPFSNSLRLNVQDKFDILLNQYKKVYGYEALGELIKKYKLGEIKADTEVEQYLITQEDIDKIYLKECPYLDYNDKLEILSQRIYQLYKGFGTIDEIRDMKIDGVSAGVSGLPYDSFIYDISYQTDAENIEAYNSIWIFFQGRTIHLSFLGFGNQKELIRVCKNIYRYGNPGQLSEAKGYLINDMKDGSRVVVFRPPLADRWAFFVRKHDSILDMDMYHIIKDEGNEIVIELLKWLVKGCLVLAITGEMGSGKTTLLKLLIQFIRRTDTIRVHEQVFELNLSRVYKDWNILTLKETDTVTGQEALNILKKTDGAVIILGEVVTHEAANYLVETAQISKMTMCSHHAKTTKDLIDSLKIAQLRVGGFQDEYLAEEQVIKAINVDIHMENKNGHRYISKITEIVPLAKENYPESLVPATLEYYRRRTELRAYKTVDILRYEDGRYKLVGVLSDYAREQILKNLLIEEKAEFNRLFATLKEQVCYE
ncbi:MAG: cpaF1 [Anaerocolumna sp.]|jgi:pilus assembly protein CpaF|nr:cpaF1 [Anaerocolumna sp.]